MHLLEKNFMKFGLKDTPRSSRPITATGRENNETFSHFYVENPVTFKKMTLLQLNLSRRSLSKSKRDLKLKLWRPRLIHTINENGFDRRFQFAEWYLEQICQDPSFKFKGHVNRYNCVYYSHDNRHLVMEGKDAKSPGMCVLGGVIGL